MQRSLSENQSINYNTIYITPERGGVLREDNDDEQNITNDADLVLHTGSQNQFNQFKQQVVYHYRLLKAIVCSR